MGSGVPKEQQLPNINDPFAYTFDYYSGAAPYTVKVLEGAGWVDDATKAVHLLFAVINPDLGYWGRVLITSTFTRGGAVTNVATVRSLPVDPYKTHPSIVVLDLVLAVYVAVYWVEALRHAIRKVRRARKTFALGHTLGESAVVLLEPWFLLDLFTGCLLVSTFAIWLRAISTLQLLRSAVTGLQWGPETVADDTFIAHAWIEAAVRDFYLFKVVGVAALAAFMLRLFWQFSLQPKLAVMTETLSRSCSDVTHFAILFGVIIVFYGVYGHVFFGGQLDRWRSSWQATWAIISFTAYDYDLQVRQLCLVLKFNECVYEPPSCSRHLKATLRNLNPCPTYSHLASLLPRRSPCKVWTWRRLKCTLAPSCSSSPTCCCGDSWPSSWRPTGA